jgi:hypothetical protein
MAGCGRLAKVILSPESCRRQNLLNLDPTGLRRYAGRVLSAMSGITIAKSYHPKAAVVVMSSKASE